MTHKEFYFWLEGYLYGRLEDKHIPITPIVEKMNEIIEKINRKYLSVINPNINGLISNIAEIDHPNLTLEQKVTLKTLDSNLKIKMMYKFFGTFAGIYFSIIFAMIAYAEYKKNNKK